MRHLFFFVIITLLQHQIAFADSTSQAPEQDPGTESVVADSSIRSADCVDFINERPQRVTCGFINLPVNHDSPGKNTVSLPILIASQTRSITPGGKAILIPGGGGPGAPIGFGYDYSPGEYLGEYDSLRAAGFDLIILDQRGVGLAKPSLNCRETSTAFEDSIKTNLSFIDSLEIYRASLAKCRDRLLAQNVKLQHFDTYQSARDYLSVIKMLPYDWWGTIATSYATVIAQEMAVLEPSVFDRILLDSPVAIDYQQPFTFEITEDALQRVLALCEITNRCKNRYGDIKAKFREVLADAETEPYTLELEVYDIDLRKRKINMQVDNITLLDMFAMTTYSNSGIAELPGIINQLHKGHENVLREIAVDYWYYNSDLDFASALSWNIHCNERQPLEEAYLRQHPESYKYFSPKSKLAFDQERVICQDWKVTTGTPSSDDEIINTETLVVAGDLDPVISREDIKNAVDNLTNKTVMIMPGTGHSVWYQSSCTRQNVTAFFAGESDSSLRECKDGIRRFK